LLIVDCGLRIDQDWGFLIVIGDCGFGRLESAVLNLNPKSAIKEIGNPQSEICN
jgi:hypothetical protein